MNITDDAIVEGLESFTLELSTMDPAVDNNFRMRALLNITDNDRKLIVSSICVVSKAQGMLGTRLIIYHP